MVVMAVELVSPFIFKPQYTSSFDLLEQLKMREELDPVQLLHGLEGWCSNFTIGDWWSYEYCHPDSLIQFHIDSKTGRIM